MNNNIKARELLYQHVYNYIKDNIDYFRCEYEHIDDFETEKEISFNLDLMLTNALSMDDLIKLGLIVDELVNHFNIYLSPIMNMFLSNISPFVFKVDNMYIKVSSDGNGNIISPHTYEFVVPKTITIYKQTW